MRDIHKTQWETAKQEQLVESRPPSILHQLQSQWRALFTNHYSKDVRQEQDINNSTHLVQFLIILVLYINNIRLQFKQVDLLKLNF